MSLIVTFKDAEISLLRHFLSAVSCLIDTSHPNGYMDHLDCIEGHRCDLCKDRNTVMAGWNMMLAKMKEQAPGAVVDWEPFDDPETEEAADEYRGEG